MFTTCYPSQSTGRVGVALVLIAAVAALSALLPTPVQAQTEAVIHNFTYSTFTPQLGCPPGTVNANPHTGLLFYKGHLYGTTPEGGTGAKLVADSDDGMVFQLTAPKSAGTPWKEKTLHSFVPDISPDDGAFPCSRLIESNGVLYGTTMLGGNGIGTIFALTPPITGQTTWTETILYTFMGESDGEEPFDGLVMGGSGGLYGVTRLGLSGINTPAVFKFADGEITHLTKTSDCTNPKGDPCIYNGDLLLDSSTGSLFGTTQNGGVNGYGNVFELTPSGGIWNYTDLYDFTGGSDGATPNGGLAGGAGDLFGTTQGGGGGTGSDGGGVLFELRQEIGGDPLYTLIVQHTFDGGVAADGAVPGAGLYKDVAGTLWGTTEYGGPFRLHFETYGTIFELYPDPVVVHEWHYAEVYAFAGEPDGAYPQGLLTEDKKGNLYGTTNAGGSANGGTVFQFTP